MITRDDAYAFQMVAQQNVPTPPLTVVRLCNTVFELYEQIEELEAELRRAAHNQCGCLGGTISHYDRGGGA